jgi:hypothetical protein
MITKIVLFVDGPNWSTNYQRIEIHDGSGGMVSLVVDCAEEPSSCWIRLLDNTTKIPIEYVSLTGENVKLEPPDSWFCECMTGLSKEDIDVLISQNRAVKISDIYSEKRILCRNCGGLFKLDLKEAE